MYRGPHGTSREPENLWSWLVCQLCLSVLLRLGSCITGLFFNSGICHHCVFFICFLVKGIYEHRGLHTRSEDGVHIYQVQSKDKVMQLWHSRTWSLTISLNYVTASSLIRPFHNSVKFLSTFFKAPAYGRTLQFLNTFGGHLHNLYSYWAHFNSEGQPQEIKGRAFQC